MEITRATEYAVRCVLHLALEPARPGRPAPRDRRRAGDPRAVPRQDRPAAGAGRDHPHPAGRARRLPARRRPRNASRCSPSWRPRRGTWGSTRASCTPRPAPAPASAPPTASGPRPASSCAPRSGRDLRRTRGPGGPLPIPGARENPDAAQVCGRGRQTVTVPAVEQAAEGWRGGEVSVGGAERARRRSAASGPRSHNGNGCRS